MFLHPVASPRRSGGFSAALEEMAEAVGLSKLPAGAPPGVRETRGGTKIFEKIGKIWNIWKYHEISPCKK